MLERADAAEAARSRSCSTACAPAADAMVADLRSGAEQLGRELAEIRRGLGDAALVPAGRRAEGVPRAPEESDP